MFNVGGFTFADEAMADQAKKEEEGIRFIKEKSTLSNPEVVFRLYTTLLQQKMFVTPVGLRFLVELQNILIAAPGIPNDTIPTIDTADFVGARLADAKISKKKKAGLEKQLTFYKRGFCVSLLCAVIFGFSVVGMFAIVELSENNLTILNYKNELINRYEGWEQELKAEEERLKEWEEDLSDREAALENK